MSVFSKNRIIIVCLLLCRYWYCIFAASFFFENA